MAEYVEKEVLISRLQRAYINDNIFGMGVKLGIDHAIKVINETPMASVADIVRCEDCIHWFEDEEVCLKIYSDGEVSPYAWQNRRPDDFCSYGDRKDS